MKIISEIVLKVRVDFEFMEAIKYRESLNYSHRYKFPNDLLWAQLLDQPIILKEKGCPVPLRSAGLNHKNNCILSLSFEVRVNDACGSPLIKNIHVSAHGASKEKIVAIETLFTETLFDSSCFVTVNKMSNKIQYEKELRISDEIEISGTLLNKVSGLPLKNKEFFIAVSEWKRYEHTRYGYTHQCLTDDNGHFKVSVLKSELGWEIDSFQISFYVKTITDLLLEYNDTKNQHHCFKIALVAAIQVEDKTPRQNPTEPNEEINLSEDKALAEIKALLEKIKVDDFQL